MKKIILLVFCLHMTFLSAQDYTEIKVTSKINEVTVFLKGAQISRSKTVDIPKGKTILKFVNLSPFINGNSIQVKAPGNFNILAVNRQNNYVDEIAKSDEITKLEDQIEGINNDINLENTHLEIIREELTFLNENKKLSGKNEAISTENLKQATVFYNQQLTKLKLQGIERRQNIKKLEDTKRRLNHTLNALTTKKDYPTGEILVKIEAKTAQKAQFQLSYTVKNAGWFPSYDIKANNINEPIELVYKANVSQDTKIDWTNVKLKLSSADPNNSGVAPELIPYFIDFNSEPPSYGKTVNNITGKVSDISGPLPGVNVIAKGSTVGTQTDFDGNYSLTIPKGTAVLEYSFIGMKTETRPANRERIDIILEEDANTLEEVVVVGYGTSRTERGYTGSVSNVLSGKVAGLQTKTHTTGSNVRQKSKTLNSKQVAKQTTFQFEIKQPYTIKSDNKSYTVSMDSYDLPASFQYYSIPKIDPSAFLMANVTDWEKYNLLEGEANIFFEETYIGKSILDVRYATDTLQISLGKDKNVQVKRENLKDFTSKKFIGSKKEEQKGWEISIKNNKNEPINLLIYDQVPVSTLDNLKISIEEMSGAKFDPEFGELKWEFVLDPKGSKTLHLIYLAKYPKYENILLE